MFSFGKLTREKPSDARYQESPLFTFFPITECTSWLASLFSYLLVSAQGFSATQMLTMEKPGRAHCFGLGKSNAWTTSADCIATIKSVGLEMNDAYLHLLMCRSMVTALHSHKCEQSSQPLLLLTKHWCVWTLARSQHVYSESGPAVHFLLWIGSYPLFNTRAEWVHKCRQETIHCSHVFSENTDKLEAVTFTHGHVSKVKQASRAAAAGCVTACVYKTV